MQPEESPDNKPKQKPSSLPVVALLMALLSLPIFFGLTALTKSIAFPGFLIFLIWLTVIILSIYSFVQALFFKKHRIRAFVFMVINCTLVVFLATILSSCGRARPLAQKAMSMTQLNGIGKALMLYQETNDGLLPPDVGMLAEEGLVSKKAFIYPGSDSTAEVVDGKLTGNPSYVFFLDFPEDAASSMIVAYEKPEFAYKGQLAILTYGGSVAKVTLDELNKQLKEQGRPPAK